MLFCLVTEEKQQYYDHLIPKEYQSRRGMPGGDRNEDRGV